MPSHSFVRSVRVVGAACLALLSGCGVEYAPSNPMLGASSGGGAAYMPPAPPAPPMDQAARAPGPAVPRDVARAPAPAPVRDGRPGRTITITAAGGEPIQLTTAPAHGTALVAGSGGGVPSVRYTPAPGYVGQDQFAIILGGGNRTIAISVATDGP